MGIKQSKKPQINEEEENQEEDFFLEDWEILNSKENINKKKVNAIKLNSGILINKVKSDPFLDYEIIKELGSGSFAKVLLVKHKINGSIRAMKVIHKKIKKNNKSNEIDVINEVGILMKMDHPNIVKIFEFYNEKENYYLVMEYCQGGELFNVIIDKVKLTEIQCAYIMYQILSAINYCHKMKIIHRDLKPENILVKQDEDGFYRVKICDFGTSQVFKLGDVQNKLVGSAYYIAPEVIEKKYNSKCDLWSCGVIMYILLTKRAPFGGKSDFEIIQNVKMGQYNDSYLNCFSPFAGELIKQLLEKNIKLRINAETAIQHPWFKIFKCKEILNDIQDEKTIKALINNLKNYKPGSIIQEVSLAFLVHNSPDLEEVLNATKLFNLIDNNGNGRITSYELYKGLSPFFGNKTSQEDINKIFDKLDTNHDNYLNCEDFVRAAIDKSIFLTEQSLKLAFKYFDKNDRGKVSIQEICSFFNGFIKEKDLEDEIKDIIKDYKKDGSEENIINFSEFSEIMKNLLQ